MNTQPLADLRLSGRRLALARVTWLLIVALGIGLYVIGTPLHFVQWESLCSGASCGVGQLTLQQAQQLPQFGLSLESWATLLTLNWFLPVLVALVVGGAVFWRKSDDAMALFSSFVIVVFELGLALDYQSTSSALQFLLLSYQILANILIILLIFVFPDGRFVPRWSRFIALLIVSIGLLTVFFPENAVLSGLFSDFAQPIGALFQIYRYWRVSNLIQRQQTKWVVFGVAISLIGTSVVGIVLTSVYSIETISVIAYLLSVVIVSVGLALVPLSVGIAILRSHLWDIDILIRRTLIYGVLSAMLALVYFGSVVLLQQLYRAFTGVEQSEIVTIISTLAIAALFTPLRRRVQVVIDHRFYRRKYDSAKVLAEFSAAARDEVQLEKLSGRLIDVVNETMQPTQVSLWLGKRTEGSRK